jgi:DNA-binding IclR family transcriptional regulator
VFDKAGDILAGLVIGVPTSGTLSQMEELQHRVGAAAVEISRLMGYADA